MPLLEARQLAIAYGDAPAVWQSAWRARATIFNSRATTSAGGATTGATERLAQRDRTAVELATRGPHEPGRDSGVVGPLDDSPGKNTAKDRR